MNHKKVTWRFEMSLVMVLRETPRGKRNSSPFWGGVLPDQLALTDHRPLELPSQVLIVAKTGEQERKIAKSARGMSDRRTRREAVLLRSQINNSGENEDFIQ